MKFRYMCFLLFVASSLCAAREYDTIYALNFFDGVSYNSTIVPYSTPEIYILAGRTSVFVVRETLLYYWPLTSEFKADWASRNVPLPGTLCIKDRRGNITRIEPEPYVIQYDMKDVAKTIGVYWGEEAGGKQAEFVRAQRNYSEAVYAYGEAMRAYNRKITGYLQNPPAEGEAFPPMPLPPNEFTILSTGVNIGFPVELPRGIYSVYFENPEGKVIPETKKRLRVFDARERVEGFQVFEEGRWSVPADFPDSNMTLFTRPEGVLYFQPFSYLHFDGAAYNLMKNPQNRYSRSVLSAWLPVLQHTERSEIEIGGRHSALQSYKVTQLAGSKLGYIIKSVDLGDPESAFSAYKWAVPAEGGYGTYRAGKTSAVSVLRIFPGIELVIVCVSLVPMGIFAVSAVRRARRYKEQL